MWAAAAAVCLFHPGLRFHVTNDLIPPLHSEPANPSLCGLGSLHADEVAALTPLTALSALTLLAAARPHPPHAGPPPFAPLAKLPALARALLGAGGGGGALGWAAGGSLLGGYAGGGPVTAYLCPAAWSELASFKVGQERVC